MHCCHGSNLTTYSVIWLLCCSCYFLFYTFYILFWNHIETVNYEAQQDNVGYQRQILILLEGNSFSSFMKLNNLKLYAWFEKRKICSTGAEQSKISFLQILNLVSFTLKLKSTIWSLMWRNLNLLKCSAWNDLRFSNILTKKKKWCVHL